MSELHYYNNIDLLIGLTDYCNFNCIQCEQSSDQGVYGNSGIKKTPIHQGNRGFMSENTFHQLINGIIDSPYSLEVCSLMWLGESLLHPQFPEFLEFFLKNNTERQIARHLTLNTNGLMFDQEITDLIFNFSQKSKIVPFSIIFSLDAASAETFKKIKQSSGFEIVTANIRNLLRQRKIPELKVVIQMLVMEENQHEAEQFINYWKRITENQIDICYDNLTGNQNFKVFLKPVCSYNQSQSEQLHRNVIERLGLISPQTKTEETRHLSRSSAVNFEYSQQRRPCPALFRSAVVNWNGDLTTCCVDTGLANCFGNINDSPLMELYNNELIESYRQHHISGEFHQVPSCGECLNLPADGIDDQEIEAYTRRNNLNNLWQTYQSRIKIDSHFAKYSYQIKQRFRLNHPYSTLIIEPTSFCNLNCIMCEQSYDRTRNKGIMNPELFCQIISNLAETRQQINNINLFWSGESFCHPQFAELIRLAEQHDPLNQGFNSLDLHTNAILMNEQIQQELINSQRFYRILFSLDAACSNTYDKIRQGGDYQQAIMNILNFLKLRQQSGRLFPRVTLQFIIMDENISEADKFIKFWTRQLIQYGTDKVQLNYDWNQPEPMGGKDVIFFKRFDDVSPEKQIYYEQLHYQFCLNHNLIKIKPNRHIANAEWQHTGKAVEQRPVCPGVFTHLAIKYDGNVSACCRDINCHLKIGSFPDQNISDLLNNELITQLRISHLIGDLTDFPICQDCPNQVSEEISDLFIKQYCDSISRPDIYTIYKHRMKK